MFHRNIIYVIAFAFFAFLLSYPMAVRFATPGLVQQVLAASSFFTYSAFLSFVYLRYAPKDAKPLSPILGGIISVFSAAVVFSVARGNITIVSVASLFSLPGSCVGLIFSAYSNTPAKKKGLTVQ